jgi:hypothetical protein
MISMKSKRTNILKRAKITKYKNKKKKRVLKRSPSMISQLVSLIPYQTQLCLVQHPTCKREVLELMSERKMQKHLDSQLLLTSSIITEVGEAKEAKEAVEEMVDIKDLKEDTREETEEAEEVCTSTIRVKTSQKLIIKKDFISKISLIMITKRMITTNKKASIIIKEEDTRRKMKETEKALVKLPINQKTKEMIMSFERII